MLYDKCAKRRKTQGLWMSRLFPLCIGMIVLGFLFTGGCSGSSVSVCGQCEKGTRCDTRTKKCVKKNTCVPCQSSAECDNHEICNDLGCCIPSDGEAVIPPDTSSDGSVVDVGSEPISDETEQTLDTGQPEVTSDNSCPKPPCGGACTDHSQCASTSTPFCDLFRKQCVQCLKADDCKPNESCENSGRCVAKTNPCEAVSCPPGEVCNPNTGSCEIQGGCTPFCKKGQVCDPNKKVCVPDCRNAGCTDPNKSCDKGSGACVSKDCRSNLTCKPGETCNQVTGKCVKGPTDCRQPGQSCNAPACCNRATGKCVTTCITCGCPTGKVCNRTTGVCGTAPACQSKSKCSSDRDCCGRSCSFSVGHLGKRCKCSSDKDCGPRYRCKSSITNKYCD